MQEEVEADLKVLPSLWEGGAVSQKACPQTAQGFKGQLKHFELGPCYFIFLEGCSLSARFSFSAAGAIFMSHTQINFHQHHYTQAATLYTS